MFEGFGGQIGLGKEGKLHRAGAGAIGNAESRDDGDVGPRVGGEVG